MQKEANRAAAIPVSAWPALVTLAIALIAFPASALAWGSTAKEYAQPIARALDLKPGDTVAEIGAGDGDVTVGVAEIVGPAGRVYSTEIEQSKVDAIRARAAAAGVGNVSAILDNDTSVELPPNCCRAVYMLGVYHHFTHPLAEDRSIFRALQPGGELLISDFYPTWLFRPWATRYMMERYGGHGAPEPIAVRDLTSVGFEFAGQVKDWPKSWVLKNYCVLFRKPAAAPEPTPLVEPQPGVPSGR